MSYRNIIVEERKRRYLSFKNLINKISGRPRIDNSFLAIISIIFIKIVEFSVSISTKAIKCAGDEELMIKMDPVETTVVVIKFKDFPSMFENIPRV